MAKRIFAELRDDFVDEHGVRYIDGYETDDDNEDGVLVGYVFNGKVYLCNGEYQLCESVQEYIKEKEGE